MAGFPDRTTHLIAGVACAMRRDCWSREPFRYYEWGDLRAVVARARRALRPRHLYHCVFLPRPLRRLRLPDRGFLRRGWVLLCALGPLQRPTSLGGSYNGLSAGGAETPFAPRSFGTGGGQWFSFSSDCRPPSLLSLSYPASSGSTEPPTFAHSAFRRAYCLGNYRWMSMSSEPNARSYSTGLNA
jgi:hypothetical protein